MLVAVDGIDELLVGGECHSNRTTIGQIDPAQPFECVDRCVQVGVYTVEDYVVVFSRDSLCLEIHASEFRSGCKVGKLASRDVEHPCRVIHGCYEAAWACNFGYCGE